MKRSYDEMATALSTLPQSITQESRIFKSSLTGTHRLRIISALDISKPKDKPIDEIDEPEEEQDAYQKKLEKNNQRMIQLELSDIYGAKINAVETEQIDLMTNLKPNWTVEIVGPVDIRCGNIMLGKKNIKSVQPPFENDIENNPVPPQPLITAQPAQARSNPVPVIDLEEEWDEDWDEDPCITID